MNCIHSGSKWIWHAMKMPVSAWKPSILFMYSCLLLLSLSSSSVTEATCGAQNNDNHFKSAPRHNRQAYSVSLFLNIFYLFSLFFDHTVSLTHHQSAEKKIISVGWCKWNWLLQVKQIKKKKSSEKTCWLQNLNKTVTKGSRKRWNFSEKKKQL